MKKFCIFFFLVVLSIKLPAEMTHMANPNQWEKEGLIPFDELLLSWNASRPIEGNFLIYISVKMEEWSPWLLYASWGQRQSTHLSTCESPVRIYQDTLEVLDGYKASGFRVKVCAEGNACLEDIRTLHVYTNGDRFVEIPNSETYDYSTFLNVRNISQMRLDHPRYKDLCSPTSTASVLSYLINKDIDAVEFANLIRDEEFDIFGNWVLNLAQASTYLDPSYGCWVQRLHNFDPIYNSLLQGLPVIVSIRGPIEGSALPYLSGHLVVVRGFDAQNRKVLCMDPAFPTDESTYVSYDFNEFQKAWNRRGRVAYIFSKK